MASMESIFLTCIIDAFENRDVMSAAVPNVFIHAIFSRNPGEDRKIMKITGKLVDILVNMYPEVYKDYVVLEKGKRVLYVEILKAIYGIMEAALLWYRQFCNDLEEYGFVFNNYDPCVANKMVNRKQQTVRFHVEI